MDSLISHNKKAEIGKLISLLIEKKFPELVALNKEINKMILTMQHFEKKLLAALKYQLDIMDHPLLLAFVSADYLMDLEKLLIRIYEQMEQKLEKRGLVNLRQSYSSTIKASGNILILAEGVMQSDLYSDRSILFDMDNSVCRNSKLEAQENIKAIIVGGEGGSGESYLKAGKKISVKKMTHGMVCIKNYCRRIFEPISDTVFDLENMKYKR